MLNEWLLRASEPVIVIIDLMALFIIVMGTVISFVAALKLFFAGVFHPEERGTRGYIKGHARRLLWMDYGRWLVAALTFQLAADIVESAIAPTWEAIGQLGAIAVIRTFLNYFLERDMEEVREREQTRAEAEVAPLSDSRETAP
ncbi:hypothetical protein ARC20_17120 [Stenotrophomonas panacihumi]|uniref:DUF1622 domain-containing protein n=1 Tax=Stenotrophomonas panacihumi TaxID=676599 RepID=A0A0R0B460_9GAMM|nr:DUF1622 domain-containing protein [Stenotrophomonas panacihumi]KRG48970.1 hypothetical protein ARC20_17120 [Stenotrophomonas panacihumi]PTN53803.1 DUF1622 domain-containing protein [Stenotrophomonas panacihumi]